MNAKFSGGYSVDTIDQNLGSAIMEQVVIWKRELEEYQQKVTSDMPGKKWVTLFWIAG